MIESLSIILNYLIEFDEIIELANNEQRKETKI